MKVNTFFIALAALSLLAVISCSKKEEVDTKVYEITMSYSKTSVMSGEEVKFTDNSLYVTSRTWTFEGGTPASSTDAVVNVSFDAAGKHKATLKVTFSNNTTAEKSVEVTVFKEIKGEMAISGLTPLGCAQFGKEISFSIEGLEGDVDKYEWTFEGGTPATSTEAAPKVVFNTRDLDCKVSCVLTRSADGAYLELEESFIAGNYPIYKPNLEYDFDPYSFETSNANAYNVQTEKKTERGNISPDKSICSIIEGGVNGTGHCLKIELSKVDPETEGSYVTIYPRDCWMTNGYLEPDKKYELKFWVKAEHTDPTDIVNIGGFTFRQQLADWQNIAACMDGLTPKDGYKDVYGIDFPGNSSTSLLTLWGKGFGDGPDRTWTECKVEFTLADFNFNKIAYNPYIYLRMYPAKISTFYLDELELNLIEE